MKRIQALTLLLASLPLAAYAASKNTAHVALDSSVKVGTTDLPKGDYKVEWNGTEPNVQVTFINGKFSTTVPARLVQQHSDQEAQFTTTKDNTTLLTGLQLHNVTLQFGDAVRAGE
jgi:hypothetical protein